MLNIAKTVENGKTLLKAEGRLDTLTAPEMEAAVKKAIEETDELVIDFEKLDYISSAGLRVLLSAQKAMNGRGTMKVTHVCPTIMEIFEVTGFSEILTVE